MLTHLLLDLRFALRLLIKAPGFSAVAVLSLALGIGANTTVYTWMRQTVLDPLPGVVRSAELIAMDSSDAAGGDQGMSYPDFKDIKLENQVLSNAFAGQMREMSCLDEGVARRTVVWYGSPGMFDVLGVRPKLGRFFVPEEERPGSALAVILSHRAWLHQWGGDPSVVGHSVKLGHQNARIVGIAPEGFFGPVPGISCDAFVPLEPFLTQGGEPEQNPEQRNARGLYVIGRPKPGMAFRPVEAALKGIFRDLSLRHPRTNDRMKLNVYRMKDGPMGAASELGKPLALLFVAVAFILMIACANVANLLLAKSSRRQREMALRTALGANQARVITQLLTESVVLGLAGGLVGVVMSSWTLGLFTRSIPTSGWPLAFDVHMDIRTLIFAVLLSILTAIVFGLVPALRTYDAHPAETLKEGGNRSAGCHQRLQSVLVVVEIAIAAALLSGSALMVKSSWAISHGSPGFDPSHVLHANVGMDLGGYDAARAEVFARELKARLGSLPGVESVSYTEARLLSLGGPKGVGLNFEDSELPNADGTASGRDLVDSDFFRTFRIPMVEGREFVDQDRLGSEPVAIVNETLARKYWPKHGPVGRMLRVNGTQRRVVGVCRDFKFRSWTEKPTPIVFMPLAQFGLPSWNLVVRTSGSPSNLIPVLRETVRAMDPNLPVKAVPMAASVADAGFLLRVSAWAMGGLGAVALFLASMGIYSVMAYSVSQRTAEIGIRMALGATPTSVLGMVMKQGGTLAGLGALLGVMGARFLGRRFADLLYQTSPGDPLIVLGIPVLLMLVALLACALPALRAARIPPTEALRES